MTREYRQARHLSGSSAEVARKLRTAAATSAELRRFLTKHPVRAQSCGYRRKKRPTAPPQAQKKTRFCNPYPKTTGHTRILCPRPNQTAPGPASARAPIFLVGRRTKVRKHSRSTRWTAKGDRKSKRLNSRH